MYHTANPTKLRKRIPRTAAIATIPPVPGLLFPLESKISVVGTGACAGGVKDGGEIEDGGGESFGVEFGVGEEAG